MTVLVVLALPPPLRLLTPLPPRLRTVPTTTRLHLGLLPGHSRTHPSVLSDQNVAPSAMSHDIPSDSPFPFPSLGTSSSSSTPAAAPTSTLRFFSDDSVRDFIDVFGINGSDSPTLLPLTSPYHTPHVFYPCVAFGLSLSWVTSEQGSPLVLAKALGP